MPDKEKAKEELRRLIDRYETIVSEGKAKQYNEERTKKDFILPLFKILGWATETDEVTAEDKVSKGRVDYGFRINEMLRLVLEAKPLKADLDKIEYAEQAVDYAWHKGVSWAVLTNFDKLILFNADLKLQNPLQNGKLRLSYKQFLERFEDLWLLSRESMESGSLDRWGERYASGPQKTAVGEQILADMVGWRDMLTKDINKHSENKRLVQSEDELDEAVQRLLDRLIFMRTCEDREFEEKMLHQTLEDWKPNPRKSLFAALARVFEHFNDNYDSKLFLLHSCDKLIISNEVIANVMDGLYRNDDKSIRYDFSLIEADVLGSIYENYLGHVLRQTAKRVKVTEKHGHRKQMGIYYTPTYIVDYIVKNTLGELLKGKKAEEIKDIKVLDPACGSGSFLIKAFDIIAKAYEQKNCHELPFDRKKDILTNNIFGVDLDPKAVEIAQLNLMLKAVEKKKLLPMLQNNVKNGNSLIDDQSVAGDKAFKWEEHFKDAMQNGGFDVVIGNPPYINNRNLLKSEKDFFEQNFTTAFQQYDIYVLFYELALRLLKPGGYMGFIAPNKFAITRYGAPLRKLLLDYHIIKIVDVSQLGVFSEASTYPYIVIVQKKTSSSNKIGFYTPLASNFKIMSLNEIKQGELNGEMPFLLNLHKDELSILSKINGEMVIDVYRAKPTTADISKKGDSTVITNREVERYNLLKGFKLIKKKKEWEIETPAILMKKICFVPTASLLDSDDAIPVNTVYVIHSKNDSAPLKYLLAILNSKLIGYYTRKKYGTTAMRGGFIELRTFEIEQIPIKMDVAYKMPLIKLVDKMLSLNKSLNELGDRKTDERLRIEDEVKRVDAEIDELVYELYGITGEEKRIIEGSLR